MNYRKNPVFRILRVIKGIITRSLFYKTYDSSAYWRMRSKEKGQSAVLWTNEHYNTLFRERQRAHIAAALDKVPQGGCVLDVGSGIGIVAKMISEMRPDLFIEGVDFEEMVSVAREKNAGGRITYIAASAEDYSIAERRYDLIISSGTISVIRDLRNLFQAIDNCVSMAKLGGIILFIDPFHKWNYLARAKVSAREIINYMAQKGWVCEKRSGILFWPFRDYLAVPELEDKKVEGPFWLGERLLERFGPNFWSDYKVLQFCRNDKA